MISALAWIPRGAAKAEPTVAEPTPEELEAMRAAAEVDGEDVPDEGSDTSDEERADSDSDMGEEEDEATAVARARAAAAALRSSKPESGAASTGGDTLAAALAELDMDHYDDEDEGGLAGLMGGKGNPGMSYHRDPTADPYLQEADSDADTDSEAEAWRIRDSDLLILAARNEDDVSHLEVWVYEEADERGPANLYVHHSLMLPAFPLAVTWLDCDPTGRRERANIAAVASFEPGIELWDMDVVDSVEPLATLGGADYAAARAAAAAAAPEEPDSGGGDKKKKKKKKKAAAPEVPVKPGSHSDAVLGLAWNAAFRNVLASASADKTVKVWDVTTQACQHTLTHHHNKVQALAWNPAEAPVLLTGGFDKWACLVDVRTPDAGSVPAWRVSADVEALAWDPHNPTRFVVAAEDGVVACYDARQGAGSSPLFQLSAHDKATCALSFCPAVPGLLATSSTDKKVKVWSLAENRPAMLATQSLNTGAVFAMSFCRDAPLTLAAGGAKGSVSVWDTMTAGGVAAYVQQHAPNVAAAMGGAVAAAEHLARGQPVDGAGATPLAEQAAGTEEPSGFVSVKNGRFDLNGREWFMTGTNIYYLAQRAADVNGTRKDTEQSFADAAALGLNVIRTWAFVDGADQWKAIQLEPGKLDEEVLREGLDYTVSLACRHGVRLLLALTNTWPTGNNLGSMYLYTTTWGGGSKQSDFYTQPKPRDLFKQYIAAILSRRNTFTGRLYSEEPCILGWDLANEPINNGDDSGDAWLEDMSAYVKGLAPQHLVASGSHGFFGASTPELDRFNPPSQNILGQYSPDSKLCTGVDFVRNAKIPSIDFATVHLWCAMGGGTRAERQFNKPVVVEEFGKARPAAARNALFEAVYDEVSKARAAGRPVGGSLFWMLAGVGVDTGDGWVSLAGGGLPSDLDAQVHTADSMVQIAFGGGNHCKRVIADGVFFTFLGPTAYLGPSRTAIQSQFQGAMCSAYSRVAELSTSRGGVRNFGLYIGDWSFPFGRSSDEAQMRLGLYRATLCNLLSPLSSGQLAVFASWIDPNVLAAYQQCLEMADAGLSLDAVISKDGSIITITLGYAKNDQGSIVFQRSAVNGPAFCKYLTHLNFKPGFVLSKKVGKHSIQCQREPKSKDQGPVSIVVATSVGTRRFDMPDLVPPTVEARLNSRVSAVQETLDLTSSRLQTNLASLRRDTAAARASMSSLVRQVAVLQAASASAGTASAGGKDKQRGMASTGTVAVKIALDWTPNTNSHAGLYIAKAQGLFAAKGLDVTIVSPHTDDYKVTPASRVESGEALLAIAPSESVISYNTWPQADRPRPKLRAVAATLQQDLSAICTLASSGIDRPAKLEGKRYASYAARYEGRIVQELIKADGGSGDYQELALPMLGVPHTLETGEADATWVFLGWEGVQADRQGLNLNTFKLGDYGIPYGYSPVLLAHPDAISSQGDTLRAVLAAAAEGYKYAAAHPEEAADLFISAVAAEHPQGLPQPLDREVAVASLKLVGPAMLAGDGRWGVMEQGRWDAFLDWLSTHGLLTTKVQSRQAKDGVSTTLDGLRAGDVGKPIPRAAVDAAALFTNDFLP
ncbi:putative WD repeat-containing [Micractinium conductrix]|uniref:WD repeat-containing n=1 Tax=Micractinium conductrix TaxID=554055 RepID=A0A2P6VE76_9CHLO|nr:putative WD repeat-containing [Micractinium conductrix]|eukprot:PSC72392.1 putative WD repeat-containing [Micractinium conductrix]